MQISVTDFSATIEASVFKFCVHLQVGKGYCVNENKDANPYFAFFFQFFMFSFCRSYIIHIDIFSVKGFSANTRFIILKFGTKLGSDELYCVTKKKSHIAYQSLYLFIFLFLQWKFLSQISKLLLKPVFSNFVYTFSHILLISPFIFHFSFSPMDFSVTDF